MDKAAFGGKQGASYSNPTTFTLKVGSSLTGEGTIIANTFTNGGIISPDNLQGVSSPTSPNVNYGVLTIDGNYIGNYDGVGGIVKMDTLWNSPGDYAGGNSWSDVLYITGNATGQTQVIPIGPKGEENFIRGDILRQAIDLRTLPVVIVENPTGQNEDAFSGTASTGGAGEAYLRHYNKGGEYRWFLGADPNYEPIAAPLAPSSSGFIQMSGINRELGLNQLGKLHDRIGEQQTYVWDCCGAYGDFYQNQKELGVSYHPIWLRGSVGELKEQGRVRFGHKTKEAFIQIGRDLRFSMDENKNHQHFGVMAGYIHAKSDFYDKYHRVKGIISDKKHVGQGETDIFSLGAYHTWYKANGTYLDLVGQISYIRNKYSNSSDVYDKNQNGYGFGISAEVGRPFKLGHSKSNGQWLFEPQAQLAYQYVHLSSIKAKNTIGASHKHISGQSDGTLRGRIGVRLAWNGDNGKFHTNTFYVSAHLLHDFAGYKSKATISSHGITDNLSERYSRTWGELQMGTQIATSQSSYLYANVSYERSLGGNKNQVQRGNKRAREGVKGYVGVRFNF